MKKAFLIAASLALLSAPAFAQGNSPYNSSGSQAGGPRAGQERMMGAPGGTPSMAPGGGSSEMAPMRSKRTMKRSTRSRKMMMHRRNRGM